MMLQWVPTHRSQAEYEMVLRSLLQVFPDATVWAGGSMLVGTKKPLSLDPDDFARKLRTSEGRAALAAVGLTSFEALTGHYTAGPEQIRAFVGKGPLLTDDHPPAVSTPAPDGPTAPGSAATCATCSVTDRPTSAPAVVARGYGWMDARTTPPNPA